MKVKNIVFSGFMAVVLAGVCGAASAAEMTGDALVVASKGYVDVKLGNVNTELSEKITALENANKEGGSVATAIAAAQEAADDAQDAADNAQSDVDTLAGKMDLTNAASDLSTALAAKENTVNKIATTNANYFTGGKVKENALTSMASDNANFPTIAAAVEIADAKAQDVLTKVNANAGSLNAITTNVEKLMGADTEVGSVAYQVKQEKERAELAEQANTDAIATLNGDASTEGSVDYKVSALETKLMDATNGTVTAAIKVEADRAKLAEQGLQSAIDTINNEQNGILAQAKDYTDNGLAKLYSNASTCIAASASKHCIMSAHADESGNPVYVWIDLTAPAE
ncbi:MAG: hypothetical protein IKL37_03995 [Alphaproteobacteria bacterium]|nr:hypothetical protein [Alphaproteobacteria bacterium]